jgi:hypothetical protein
LGKIGLSLIKKEGIQATFLIEGDFGLLEIVSLWGENNKISLDMESWKKIFGEYFEYKGVRGYILSLGNGDPIHSGMSVIAFVGGQLNNYDGIYFMEEK